MRHSEIVRKSTNYLELYKIMAYRVANILYYVLSAKIDLFVPESLPTQ